MPKTNLLGSQKILWGRFSCVSDWILSLGFLMTVSIYLNAFHTAVFFHLTLFYLHATHSNRACKVLFESLFYLPIGVYLLCIYSIAYFFAICNIQIVTNSQLFFVKNGEIHLIHQSPIYKSDFLCYNGYVVLRGSKKLVSAASFFAKIEKNCWKLSQKVV